VWFDLDQRPNVTLQPDAPADLDQVLFPGALVFRVVRQAGRVYILRALERFGRNHSRAAEALAIGCTNLWPKLKAYEIEQRVR
jgi:DNA-binding NtrC family response regulator